MKIFNVILLSCAFCANVNADTWVHVDKDYKTTLAPEVPFCDGFMSAMVEQDPRNVEFKYLLESYDMYYIQQLRVNPNDDVAISSNHKGYEIGMKTNPMDVLSSADYNHCVSMNNRHEIENPNTESSDLNNEMQPDR